MSTYHLDIVTPTRIFDEGQVSYIRCPGTDGLFGVMAGHTNAILALVEGEVKIVKDRETKYLAVSGGFAEITREGVELLVETAEQADEIDEERAAAALKRARARIREHAPDLDIDRATAAIRRALARRRVYRRG